jgi:hypothetical protein
MQKRKILVVVAVVLLLGATGAMAQSNRDEVARVSVPKAGPGEMYSRSSLIPHPETTSMPTPVDPQTGPVADVSRTDSTLTMDGMSAAGGAMLTPRGGAMFTPKQRADREIRLLIRRLD